ncbi:hypothetical protein N0V93_007134 [Gnomoniopsis smithogilvyi]|uniref:Rhodopsin domain-containing protein n=1 Tax=Gnomoniopsis smithogilvyi TaxID=1191159 RepID=A0A9W9CWC8_9PEZI|nr:hypothetical protein N0V93_007134 [Gnomoniopsis smithogilvyi]
MFLANLLTCRPISGNWAAFTAAPTQALNGAACVNPIPRYWTSQVVDIFTDILIFILPQPLVWGLQMSTSKKVGVSAVFAVGAFVLAIGVIRLAIFIEAGKQAAKSYDVTYDQAPTHYWTELECAIAVICACLPTLRVNIFTIIVSKVRSYASNFWLQISGRRQGSKSTSNLSCLDEDGRDASTDTESPFQPASHNNQTISMSTMAVPHHYPVYYDTSAIDLERQGYLESQDYVERQDIQQRQANQHRRDYQQQAFTNFAYVGEPPVQWGVPGPYKQYYQDDS